MKMFLSALMTTITISLLSSTSIARADEDNDQRNADVVTPLVSDLKGSGFPGPGTAECVGCGVHASP
jgi:hypothetical protein